MAWSLTQTATGSRGRGNTLEVTFSSAVAQGDLIVVLAANGSGAPGTTMSDAYGNTYYQAAQALAANLTVEIWWAVAIGYGSGFYVIYSPGEFSSQAGTIMDAASIGNYQTDGFSGQTGSGTNLTSNPFTTTGTDLLVGIGGSGTNGQTWTMEGGLTNLFSTPGAGSVAQASGYSINVPAGSQSIAMQDSVSGAWACVGAAFSSEPPPIATATYWNYQKPIERRLTWAQRDRFV